MDASVIFLATLHQVAAPPSFEKHPQGTVLPCRRFQPVNTANTISKPAPITNAAVLARGIRIANAIFISNQGRNSATQPTRTEGTTLYPAMIFENPSGSATL